MVVYCIALCVVVHDVLHNLLISFKVKNNELLNKIEPNLSTQCIFTVHKQRRNNQRFFTYKYKTTKKCKRATFCFENNHIHKSTIFFYITIEL